MFPYALRRAVALLAEGKGVGQVARRLGVEWKWSVEQAHMTARAAEVYTRMLKRDIAREQWEAEKERRRELGQSLVVRWID